MWHLRYKNKFKTRTPNLIITAVQTFPNMVDTVDKAIVEYGVKKMQNDATLLEIESLYWLEHGRDFIPLYFEDDVPKLATLPKLDTKSMFWCIGYVSTALTRDDRCREITLPTHKRFRELLEYSIAKLDSKMWQYLFRHCVDKYVVEQTSDFNERQKYKRFINISNTSLNVLEYSREKIEAGTPEMKPEDCIPFLDAMYKRDIYEFMFNEYIGGRY